MLNMCHPSIYWGCSREKRDTNPCPHGVYILLGDIWRESFLQKESEMRVRLVTCGPVHLLQWSRQRVVADEVGGLREQLGWGFGCSYKDLSFSSLEKDMATPSSTLTWKIPWTLVGCSPWVMKSWSRLSDFTFTFKGLLGGLWAELFWRFMGLHWLLFESRL